MTITTEITKAELIAAIGRALMAAGRADEAALFYAKTATARDVQEVMQIRPDDVPVEYAP